MATRLAGKDTRFLPFNQGSNGAGRDGGAGNPPNPNGYLTAYLWEEVFQKDSMMDILQKFMSLQDGKTLIFPRYHQLDVVRKLVADVRQKGAGQHYLIQHSAGSGKSNSIAWTAYRLASLFNTENKPVFASVIVVTDRTVLDAQLQETISASTIRWARWRPSARTKTPATCGMPSQRRTHHHYHAAKVPGHLYRGKQDRREELCRHHR